MPYRSPSDPRTRLPLLERVAVATPCSAKWEDMVGSDTARFCCTCSKTVYDLSAMDAVDAEAFLAPYLDAGEMPCARFYRRRDGRVLTSECAPGARRRHAVRAAKAIAITLTATAVALGAATTLMQPTLGEDDDERVDNVLEVHSGAAFPEPAEVMGEVDFSHLARPRGVVRVDEGAIAEAAGPESELLGTAARTARIVEQRRVPDSVLPGHIALVSR